MAAAAKPPDFSTNVDEEDIEVSDTHLEMFFFFSRKNIYRLLLGTFWTLPVTRRSEMLSMRPISFWINLISFPVIKRVAKIYEAGMIT